jgi:hypothetical protein
MLKVKYSKIERWSTKRMTSQSVMQIWPMHTFGTCLVQPGSAM